jgi:flagellar hook-associated protein 1 FlgK
MTISGALSNAMSGLRAATRGSEVISSNISNALTEGYGRRVLSLSPQSVGSYGGVKVNGITRIVDQGLASDRRLADSEHGHATIKTDFFEKLEGFMGTPDNPMSISARLSGFENSLITAASRPDAPERLSAVVTQAKTLASSLVDASKGLQLERTRADKAIDAQVKQLNNALKQVEMLNSQITAGQVQGGNTAGLLDARQQVVDEIALLVPVRSVPRDNGKVALYTIGGAILIDGTAAQVGFEPSNIVTAYMSKDAGTLSGLTINGIEVRTGSENGALRGGTIGAHFAVRDEFAVTAQTELDAVARDLVERFQDPTVDPTLNAGDAGLFTDAGIALDVSAEQGLSGRLAINDAVNPDEGGAVWRLRDGINATVPGDVGNSALLNALRDTLSASRTPASGGFGGSAYSANDIISTLTSRFGADRTNSEQILSYASIRLSELTQRQLADGVNTDDELQRLLLVEQAYGANVRMIQTIDEMMETLLRI